MKYYYYLFSTKLLNFWLSFFEPALGKPCIAGALHIQRQPQNTQKKNTWEIYVQIFRSHQESNPGPMRGSPAGMVTVRLRMQLIGVTSPKLSI